VATFTQENLLQLSKIPEIAHVITTNISMETIGVNDKNVSTQILGITADYFTVNHISIVKGRLLSTLDFSQSNNLIMLQEKSFYSS
jgi:putative ABC transport system permease protein